MSERKGLLTPDQQKFVGKLIGDKVRFKNPVLELLDDQIATIIVGVVDDNLLDKIPEEWQSPLEPVIDECIQGNWEAAGQLAADLANQKIDIPGIDELSEQLIFGAIFNLIIGLILDKVKKETE